MTPIRFSSTGRLAFMAGLPQTVRVTPITSPTKRKRHRTAARLPVPIPLPEAIEQGHFGKDPDTDEPINPRPAEVRPITENRAERMIDLLDQLSVIRASDYRQKDLLEGE